MTDVMNSVTDHPSAPSLAPAPSQRDPASGSCPLATQTFRDLDQLGSLREIWESWPGSRDSDLDYFSAVVRSRGDQCRPFVVLASREGSPEGMLIGLLERRKVPVGLNYITICHPEVTLLEFVPGGLRGNVSRESCAALVRHVIRSLDEGSADAALWHQLDVQSPLYQCALRLPRFAQRDHSHRVRNYWSLQLQTKGLDAFLAHLSRSQRSKLRRKYKKVLSRFGGRIRVCCICSLSDADSAISDIGEIASKSGGGPFSDKSRNHQPIAVAAEKGWLRIFVLYFEDRPAAFWIGTLHCRRLQADRVGFDPAWSEFSPGIFLLLTIIEHCREEDVGAVDFGYGETQLYESFCDVRRRLSDVCVYAPTLRGLRLSILNTAVSQGAVWAKYVLGAAHGLAWARHFIRRRYRAHRREVFSPDSV